MERKTKLEVLLESPDKLVGSKQVLRGLSEGKIRCVILSEDADRELKTRIENAAALCSADVLFAPSMKWLGAKAGIEVGASVVGFCHLEAIES
jgi:ribosomal protein L7Ae-like RNA K-turn-binding protein